MGLTLSVMTGDGAAREWKLAEGSDARGSTYVSVDAVLPDRAVSISIRGVLDTRSSIRTVREVFQVLALPISRLSLNLAAVSFIDSSGLGVLNLIRTQALGRQIVLTLRDIPPPVSRVLELSGMLSVFTIEEPEEPDCDLRLTSVPRQVETVLRSSGLAEAFGPRVGPDAPRPAAPSRPTP